MDGRSNRGNKDVFSNFPGIVWTGPTCYIYKKDYFLENAIAKASVCALLLRFTARDLVSDHT